MNEWKYRFCFFIVPRIERTECFSFRLLPRMYFLGRKEVCNERWERGREGGRAEGRKRRERKAARTGGKQKEGEKEGRKGGREANYLEACFLKL